MTERELEDILCKYPELIEEELTLTGRQISVYGKIMDILFEDKFGDKLIVELKRDTISRTDIGQIMEYEGGILGKENPAVRVMLIGDRVPPNFQKALDYHGIEWKEIKKNDLFQFLEEKNDKELSGLVMKDKTTFSTEDKEEQGKIGVYTENKDSLQKKGEFGGKEIVRERKESYKHEKIIQTWRKPRPLSQKNVLLLRSYKEYESFIVIDESNFATTNFRIIEELEAAFRKTSAINEKEAVFQRLKRLDCIKEACDKTKCLYKHIKTNENNKDTKLATVIRPVTKFARCTELNKRSKLQQRYYAK